MLPEWLDPDTLRWLILAAIAAIIVAMYVTARFIQRLVLRLVLFVVLAGLGLALWVQRTDLRDCVDTCSCSLFGQGVEIPVGRNPSCR
ncbi:MAG: hypothetical protein ACE5GB_11840 [Acidimicrobiales bacterium]